MKNNDPRQNSMKDSESKLELANKIARQSKKVVKTYATIEDGLFKGVRWLSSWIDRILFNPRYGKIVSLALAVLLYLTVNFTNTSFSNNIQSVYELSSVPVTINYNSDMFEISGLPGEVAAYVMGEMSDVQLVRTQKSYSVVADLSGPDRRYLSGKAAAEGFLRTGQRQAGTVNCDGDDQKESYNAV